MPTFPHRIRRQRWRVRAGSAAAAFTLRQHLRDDWQSALLPAFEQVFDHEVPGTDVVHISKIELNLNVGPEEKVGARWSALIHDQLLRQLRETLRARHGVQEKSTGWKKSTARESRFQNLLHYLHFGSVTWEAAGIPAPEVAAELEETCRERWPDLQTLLQAASIPSLEFCFRLLQLLSPAEASAAVRAILGEASFPWETSLVEIFASLLAPGQKHFGRYTQLQLAALLLSEALAARRDKIVPDLARIARRASSFESGALDHFIASLPAPAGTNATSDFIAKAEIAATKQIGFRTKNSSPAVSPKISAALQKKESAGRALPFAGAERDNFPASPPVAADAVAPSDSVIKEKDATPKEIGPHRRSPGSRRHRKFPATFHRRLLCLSPRPRRISLY